MKYPSFKAQYKRDPVPGEDFDPDGDLCQDDYEYFSGSGRYSDNALEAGSIQAIFYELCHLIDEIFHAIGLDNTRLGFKFCQWAHRKD